MDQHLIFDAIPGLQHISNSIDLSNTLEKHQDLQRWEKKQQKIDAQFLKTEESNINRKINESVAFKNDKMFKTVFSKSLKKKVEKAKAVNAEAYTKWKEQYKIQLENTNIEFKEDLKRLEEKWFKDENKSNIKEKVQETEKEQLQSDGEDESDHLSHDSSTVSSDYHPIEERIPEEFFSDTVSLSTSISEDNDDDDDDEYRQEVDSN